MASQASLMALPSEIRELILIHLFDTSRLYHIRCPKHCRLRASRLDKDDASGILSTCRLLRHEAMPIFFDVNVLRFRHSSDILEFLGDSQISHLVKENITRIVVDDGDIMDVPALKWAQVNAVGIFAAMPRLQALEFRAWARTDNGHYLANLNALSHLWELIKECRATTGTIMLPAIRPDQYFTLKDVWWPFQFAIDALKSAQVHVTISQSQEKYETAPRTVYSGMPASDTNLKVCNLLLSKNANEQRILSCAKEAVAQRMKVAGAAHIKDDNVLERLTWGVDEFHWIDMANPRALGERYH